MKCLSGIKNDYFEYNLLYSTFGKNIIESRINNLRPSFVEIVKSFNIKYNHFSTILNVVPFPSSDSFTKIFPLWYSSTIRFTSDRPSPQPRSLVVNPG